MKKLFNRTCSIFLLLMAFSLTMPLEAMADDPEPITFPIGKKKKGDGGGQCIPGRPIMCTISMNGGIQGIDELDIISYEIWDIDANSPVAVYSDEADFVNFIYASAGVYQIIIETNEYFYLGIIELE